jgi:hypothetical protein
MPLTEAEAQAALADVNAAMAQSATLRGYQAMSPHLIIWGVVWVIGYSASYVLPAIAGVLWPALVVLGITGDIIAGRADRGGPMPPAIYGLMAVYGLFVVAVILVMQPQDPRQTGAFFPLVIAAAYGAIGSFGAPRMLILGGALAALTLAGFFTLGQIFTLYMAVVAGGGLILGGLWLRRA